MKKYFLTYVLIPSYISYLLRTCYVPLYRTVNQFLFFNQLERRKIKKLEWFSSILILNLIGISTNLDNTSIGIAYGLNNIRIPFWFNMIINIIGFFSTMIGVFLGYVISQFISQKETGLVSFCILFCIGLFTIYNDWFVCEKKKLR